MKMSPRHIHNLSKRKKDKVPAETTQNQFKEPTNEPATQYHWFLFQEDTTDYTESPSENSVNEIVTTEKHGTLNSVKRPTQETQPKPKPPLMKHKRPVSNMVPRKPQQTKRPSHSYNSYGYVHPKPSNSYGYIQLFDQGDGQTQGWGWGKGHEYTPGASLLEDVWLDLGLLLLPLPILLCLIPLMMAPAVPIAFLVHSIAHRPNTPLISPTDTTTSTMAPPESPAPSFPNYQPNITIIISNLTKNAPPPLRTPGIFKSVNSSLTALEATTIMTPLLLSTEIEFTSNEAERVTETGLVTSIPITTTTQASDTLKDTYPLLQQNNNISLSPLLQYPLEKVLQLFSQSLPSFPLLFLNNTFDELHSRKKHSKIKY